MQPLTDLLILATCLVAGVVGAIGGVGGGILIVPALTVLFGVDLHLAIGASIVSVIATSSGAGAAYVRDELTNLRVAMFLEVATTAGAVGGALLAAIAAPQLLYLLFALVLLLSAGMQLARIGEELPPLAPSSGLVAALRLSGAYPDRRLERRVPYASRRPGWGFMVMVVAGVLSGLLGIGSGALKVLAMDVVMRLPMKVSSTTSNFMIGVTAAASAGVYLARGDVDATLAAPVALGVLAGAFLGSRILPALSNAAVRRIFLPILLAISAEMLLRALGIGL